MGPTTTLVVLETAHEIAVLLDIAAPAATEAVRLAILPDDADPAFRLCNELPVRGIEEGVVVELGHLHAGERRHILLEFEVPPGAARICELELRWGSTCEKLAVDVAGYSSPTGCRCRSRAVKVGTEPCPEGSREWFRPD